jgi:uncharacterized protein YndB with AHSA1/START domain
MRVCDLKPGMLIEPIAGAHWMLVPWRGHDGNVTGEYLSVSPPYRVEVYHSWEKHVGIDSLLYIGPLDRTDDGDMHTPGRQLMFHSGRALSVDPASWRYLKQTIKNK